MIVSIEVAFYLIYRFYLLPCANRITAPGRSISHGRKQHRSLLELLGRIERSSNNDRYGPSPKARFLELVAGYFYTTEVPQELGFELLPAVSKKLDSPPPSPVRELSDFYDSDSESSSHSDAEEVEDVLVAGDRHNISKEAIDIHLAWAYFDKRVEDMESWETCEMDKIYSILNERLDLSFAPATKSKTRYHPRCVKLEPMSNAIHRPLVAYMAIMLLKFLSGVILRIKGYERIVSNINPGIFAWHRRGSDCNTSNFLPMVFFHGVSPGGLGLYLPMILGGLATETDRTVILFENPSISCTMDFSLSHPTAGESAEAFAEILERLGYDNKRGVQLVGHSFGSFVIGWVLKSRLLNVKQVTLIDPPSILISEAAVLTNFFHDPRWTLSKLVASSEFFTSYYIRRHIQWFNCEVLLDDLADAGIPAVVCPSENDELFDASSLRNEANQFSSIDTIFWNDAHHGDCVTSLSKWRQIKQAMLKQELIVVKQENRV